MSVTIAPSNNAPNRTYAKWGLLTISNELKAWIVSAPSNKAVVESPGMPSAIMGITAPPIVALLAVSVAKMPSIVPLPYSSGCLDALFPLVHRQQNWKCRNPCRARSRSPSQ